MISQAGAVAAPSEKQLRGEHGIARETARKAVRVLRDEGLVEIVQGRFATSCRATDRSTR